MLNGRNREIIDFAGRVSDVSKRMGYSAGLLLLFLLSLTSLPVEAQSNIQPAQPAFNLRRIYTFPPKEPVRSTVLRGRMLLRVPICK